MTEIMPVPRNSNITVLRPPSIWSAGFLWKNILKIRKKFKYFFDYCK